jgi:hypothetical protein
MLRRFQAGPPRRLLAEAQKAADLITEFGQRLVIGRAQILRDMPLLYISYHDMSALPPKKTLMRRIHNFFTVHKTIM